MRTAERAPWRAVALGGEGAAPISALNDHASLAENAEDTKAHFLLTK